MSNWEGFELRECTDHRTTGGRAWCFDCTEWCYENSPCRGCELPALRSRLEAAERKVAAVEALADEADSMSHLNGDSYGAVVGTDDLRERLASVGRTEPAPEVATSLSISAHRSWCDGGHGDSECPKEGG